MHCFPLPCSLLSKSLYRFPLKSNCEQIGLIQRLVLWVIGHKLTFILKVGGIRVFLWIIIEIFWKSPYWKNVIVCPVPKCVLNWLLWLVWSWWSPAGFSPENKRLSNKAFVPSGHIKYGGKRNPMMPLDKILESRKIYLTNDYMVK